MTLELGSFSLPLHPKGVRRDCKGLKPQQHTQAGESRGEGIVEFHYQN